MNKNELQKAIIKALAAAPLVALEELKKQINADDAAIVQRVADALKLSKN